MVTLNDQLQHFNPNYSITDITDSRGGIRSVTAFDNISLNTAFVGIPDKLKTNHSLLLETSTNKIYYLSGTAAQAITTSGWTLLFGAQGFQGAQGAQGTQGTQGSQGTQGFQGTQGAQGTQGFQGNQGTQGNKGDQGFQGAQGNQGTQGRQGAQGTQGTLGNFGGDSVLMIPAYYTFPGTMLSGFIGSISTNSLPSGTTMIQISNTDFQGVDISNWNAELSAATGANKGYLRVSTDGSSNNYAIYRIDSLMSGMTGPTGQYTLNVTYISGNGPTVAPYFPAVVSFSRSGDSGTGGAQGNQGAQGTQGNQGTQGAQGTQGIQGAQGNQGTQGAQGNQ